MSRWGMSSLGNMRAEMLAGLVYLVGIVPVVGFIGQIIIFAMEKNRFTKFHAAQAMAIGLVWSVVSVLTSSLRAGLGSDSSAAAIITCPLGLIGLATFVFWLMGMISAFQGKPTKLPIIGSIAEGLIGGPVI